MVSYSSILANIILFLASGLGLFWFTESKAPLYFRILSLATVCYTAVSMFRSVYYGCYEVLYQEPGITFLGFFGCFMFLFSANYGQFDFFIDDRTKDLLKYRMAALAAPVILLLGSVIYVVVVKDKLPIISLLLTLIGFAPAIPASYYNLKHLILPDMGYSFTEGVRMCNLFALLIEVFELVRMFISGLGLEMVEDVCLVCIAMLFFGLTLFAKRGSKLWYL